MVDLGAAVTAIGAMSALAAAILRRVHIGRITRYLQAVYPGLSSDLAGGRYRRNPMILRNRLHALLASGRLRELDDRELDARIRIYRLTGVGIGLGVAVTLLGALLALAE